MAIWDAGRAASMQAFLGAAVADGAIVVVAVLLGLAAHMILFRINCAFIRGWKWSVDEEFFLKLKRASRLLFPLLAVQVASPSLKNFVPNENSPFRQLLTVAIIAAVTRLVLVIVWGLEQHVKRTHSLKAPDNYSARRLHTQVTMLSRAVNTFIVVVGIAVGLMAIPRVKELGASVLASAGLAGIVIGLAARPVLENLVTGLQIALTQPLNLEDVVVINGQWGHIEEINTTYVVVRVWDERRLIVPFSKILQESFENWTRRSAQLLGTVFIYTDYTVPVPAVRDELRRIVEHNDHWDQRVCQLEVTDAKEQSLELRALVSAANSDAIWNLRVQVREELVHFLQQTYPDCFTRTRLEVPPAGLALQNGDAELAGNASVHPR